MVTAVMHAEKNNKAVPKKYNCSVYHFSSLCNYNFYRKGIKCFARYKSSGCYCFSEDIII